MPKLVNSSRLTVHRRKATVNREPLTVNRFRRFLGFTLVEILVVISIIGVLIAVAIPSYTNAQKKGRDARRKADLKSITQALELYFQTNKTYPYNSLYYNIFPFPCYSLDQLPSITPTFLKKLPTDPRYPYGYGSYIYYPVFTDNGALPNSVGVYKYYLYSLLENNNDPEKMGTAFNPSQCYDMAAPSGETYQYAVENQ